MNRLIYLNYSKSFGSISCRSVANLANNKLTGPDQLEITLSNGRKLEFSVGKWARMADASATGHSGETTVMVTGVSSKKPSGPVGSFVPLTVDYRQRAAAAGRIPTNHLRREMGPSEKEILVGRMIDRSIRPCFPKEFTNETQIICNLLAVDSVNDPEVLSLNTTSVALACSPIPWLGPVAATRVAILGEKHDIIVNPTRHERSQSNMEIVVAGTESKNIVMLEGSSSKPVGIPYIEKAIVVAMKNIRNIIEGINKLSASVNIEKRQHDKQPELSTEIKSRLKTLIWDKVWSILADSSHNKKSRDVAISTVREESFETIKLEFPDVDVALLLVEFSEIFKKMYFELVEKTGFRADGRTRTELRPLSCQVSLFEPLHGSALFQRGQTQVMCSTSLDSPNSALRIDTMSYLIGGVKEKNFMLHYEFPPFATNEIGRTSRTNRRELGHGALAEKSIRPLIPSNYDFTIRLSCDVLESNGSSSMASVCAGSMALMDAGVPIETHVAGVAMGLLTKESVDTSPHQSDGEEQDAKEINQLPSPKYMILSDILGMEDFLGEMDFKIAGTKTGITAMQLDVKTLGGIPRKIIFDALAQSRSANSAILKEMNKAISTPQNVEGKTNHPVISKITVPKHKKSALFGFGGMNLKRITAETGAQINEDLEDSSQLIVFAPNTESFNEANELIQSFISSKSTEEPTFEFGAIYQVKVTEIRPTGVLVSLHENLPPAFLPLKELDMKKIGHPSAIGVKEGDTLHVKYFGRDPVSGHIRISRRILQMTSARNLTIADETIDDEANR